jgi:hypothetical protein
MRFNEKKFSTIQNSSFQQLKNNALFGKKKANSGIAVANFR